LLRLVAFCCHPLPTRINARSAAAILRSVLRCNHWSGIEPILLQNSL